MPQAIRHALIMAAGRGNRMRPLTDKIPKAMLPLKESTLVGNSLASLRKNVTHIHVTVGYKAAMLSHYLMTTGVDSVFNTEGHSNSWWIHNTLLRHLDEPVLVLTADNITEIDIELLSEEYHKVSPAACMLVPVRPIQMIDGDYIEDENSVVTSVQRQTPTEIYCSGIQVLNPARVASLTKDGGDFRSIWDQLISLRQLRVSSVYPYAWFSVDTLEQLASVSEASELGAHR